MIKILSEYRNEELSPHDLRHYNAHSRTYHSRRRQLSTQSCDIMPSTCQIPIVSPSPPHLAKPSQIQRSLTPTLPRSSSLASRSNAPAVCSMHSPRTSSPAPSPEGKLPVFPSRHVTLSQMSDKYVQSSTRSSPSRLCLRWFAGVHKTTMSKVQRKIEIQRHLTVANRETCQ